VHRGGHHDHAWELLPEPVDGFAAAVGAAVDHDWRFAIYPTNNDCYEPAVTPTGVFVGDPEDALDTARGRYLDNP